MQRQIKLTGHATSYEVKIGNKFKKYLSRMSEVIEGSCKKIPSTPVLPSF